MPSYGQKQKPAGVELKNQCKPIVGTRNMVSNNMTVVPTLRQIDNIPYKVVNPKLLAQSLQDTIEDLKLYMYQIVTSATSCKSRLART